LLLALKYELKTIAFPNISTGIYGFPKEKAAVIALRETENFLKNNPDFEKVIFAIFDKENLQIYKKLIHLP
jgi:O-acetyl-ADP-ribose deacetylase (regulator of RNase III)